MKLSFALVSSVILITFVRVAEPAELQNQFEIGRAYYESGEFKKAISHFEVAVKLNLNEARAYYFMGKCYETLALIDEPLFGNHASAKAHRYLVKAFQLAPADREYRFELFEFLLLSGNRKSLDEAQNILQRVNESDPDYPFLQARLEEAREERSAPEQRAEDVFLMPLRLIRIAQQPFPLRHSPGL